MNQKPLFVLAIGTTVLLLLFVIVTQVIHHVTPDPKENWRWSDRWDVNPPKPEHKPEPKPEPKPDPKPEGQIFTTNYEEGLKLAEQHNMRAVLFFHASWCKYCKKMENEVFVDPKVKEALKKYVLVMVDTDNNRQVASKYKVEGIPALHMVNSKGEDVQKGANYLDVNKFIAWLNAQPQPQQPQQPQKPQKPTRPHIFNRDEIQSDDPN